MDQKSSQSPITDALSNSEIRVEGKHLIVRSDAVLPQFCVKTNEAVQQEDILQRRLSWCPPIVGLLILLSGLILIIVYFIIRKRCRITFGLSPAIRRKNRNRRIFKIGSAIILFFALPFAAAIDSTLIIVMAFVLFLVSIVLIFVGNSPLTITKHNKGEFWIFGCSKEFLSRFMQVHHPVSPNAWKEKRMNKPFKFIGLAFAAIICATVIALIIVGAYGPETSVYTGRQIPKRFMTTIRSLKLLKEDERIKYFYSDAMLDIKTGLYFVTDKNLVLYSSEWEEPETIIPFEQISSLDAEYDDSFFNDTMVYITTYPGMSVSFPVSSDNGMDKRFIEAIEEKLDLGQDVSKSVDNPSQ